LSAAAPASVLEVQVDALLERVAERRARRVSEIRTSTEAQIREIMRAARAEARASLHQAVVRERTRMAQGLRQAEAHAELESRQRAQLETLTLLRSMWEHLGAELAERWSGARPRGAWIAAALKQAGELFPGRAWRIEHAAGVSPEDRPLGEALARAAGASVEWVADTGLRAGLRVRAGPACVDASLDGLLAERADIEALFLAEYLAAPAQEPPP
jgi:hypothetical protein